MRMLSAPDGDYGCVWKGTAAPITWPRPPSVILHHSYQLPFALCRQQGEGFAMHHLIAQEPCLVAESGEWAADYVVRMEHLQEDMREVRE